MFVKRGINVKKQREEWSSRIGFILSSAGAAIGLGAIWKFPYVTGNSGGGAFFLIFIIFTLAIGLPLLLSEFIIGRSSQGEAVTAYKRLAPGTRWPWIGRLGVVGCLLLLSFYSVVGGWITIYAFMSLFGQVINSTMSHEELFGYVTTSPLITLVGLIIFSLLNVIVIALGVRKGIERANKYMMPILFIFFVILVVRALTIPGAWEGVRFFLKPDFSSITGESVLYALGQSFFSLAVGFSCMVTYSSYLNKKVNLRSSAQMVAGMNIFVSLLAGLAIFPVVFALGFEPTEGPGLLFIVLPSIFEQIPLGQMFLTLFLLLFLFATLTSSFSLYEVIVASITNKEKYANKRSTVTWLIGLLVLIAAIPAALSSSRLEHISIFGMSFFDATDYLVSNILLPIGCLLIALFIGWRMKESIVKEEFLIGSAPAAGIYKVWRFIMRWIVPITIVIVMMNIIGVF